MHPPATARPSVLFLCILLGLTACAGGDGPETSATAATPEAATETAATGEPTEGTTSAPAASEPSAAPSASAAATEPDPSPRTLEHKYGQTEVEGVPERIVTVGLTDQDYVIGLGFAPVGTSEWFGEQPGALYPWAREALGDAPMPEGVNDIYELDIEAVAALEPDLILGSNSGLTQDQYDRLSQIAPTVAQPGDHPDYGAPWQVITQQTGAALGVPELAAQTIADIEAQFDQVREEHPELQESTGLVAAAIGTDFYIYDIELMKQIGLPQPDAARQALEANDFQPVQLSQEQLVNLLDADVLMLQLYGTEYETVLDLDVYANLETVREGRVAAVPELSVENASFVFTSILSIPIALEETVPLLAAAVDGDPSTEVPGTDPLEASAPAATTGPASATPSATETE